MEPAQVGDGVVGRPAVAALPRRRPHARRARRARIPARSTATAATCARRRAGRRADPRRGDRAADRSRGLTRARRAPPAGRACRRCCAGAGAARPTCMRSFFSPRRRCSAPALVAGPMVWGISPEQPGTGLGALSYAMRHVGRRRPPGRRQRRADRGAARRGRRTTAASVRTDSAGRRRSCCDGDAVRRASRLARRHRDHGADRRVGVRPAAHVRASGCAHAAGRRGRDDRAVAAAPPHAEGYESKIDAVARPRAAAARQRAPACRRRSTIAPTIAEMDRAATLLPAGGILERPALLVNVPSLADPSVAPAGPPRVQPRGAADAVPPAGRLGRVGRAAALAGAVRRRAASRASSTRSSTGGR